MGTEYLYYLAGTCVVELSIAALWMSIARMREHRLELLVILAANFVTHPLSWSVFVAANGNGWLPIETIVVVIEFLLLARFTSFRGLSAFSLSLAMNSATALIGLLIS